MTQIWYAVVERFDPNGRLDNVQFAHHAETGREAAALAVSFAVTAEMQAGGWRPGRIKIFEHAPVTYLAAEAPRWQVSPE